MTVEQIVAKFKKHEHYVGSGAGKLSKRWKCTREDIYTARKIYRLSKQTKRLPKILLFDIETSPMISYHFGHWNQNISLDQVIENPIMLTWSAKYLYDDNMISYKLTKEEALSRNDKRIVTALWKLINEADILVGHYSSGFDVPMMNTRFIINGLPPTLPKDNIDTKVIASKQFKFPSNKLDALAGYFGFEKKFKTDFMLWRKCMEGNEESLEEMRVYNAQDVRVLEEVYMKLRPFIKGHPNVGMYLESEDSVCPNCGNNHMHIENKAYYTPTGRYTVYRCECGALARSRTQNLDKKIRKSIVVSVGK